MLFQLEHVSLRRAGQLVLDDVTASIPAGTTAVVGPSGSGKSTLLRLLNRLADPDAGVVRFRGRDLRELDPLELRRRVGLVGQLPALLDGSVADNIAFAARLAGHPDAAPEPLLVAAGLDAGFAGRDVGELSVGEQQRVMLARALAQQPEVLLLDEPTSALDAVSRDAVEATLRSLAEHVSLVIVTHDRAQAARLASYGVELERGRARPAAALEARP